MHTPNSYIRQPRIDINYFFPLSQLLLHICWCKWRYIPFTRIYKDLLIQPKLQFTHAEEALKLFPPSRQLPSLLSFPLHFHLIYNLVTSRSSFPWPGEEHREWVGGWGVGVVGEKQLNLHNPERRKHIQSYIWAIQESHWTELLSTCFNQIENCTFNNQAQHETKAITLGTLRGQR